MKEQDIIYLSLENLERNLHIRGMWDAERRMSGTENGRPGFQVDGRISLEIEGMRISLYAEIKREVRSHQVEHLLGLATQFSPLMVVANKIFPNAKEQLRENNIAYVETSGNIYLKQKDVLVWVEGNKPIVPQKERKNRAFTKTGLKVIFQFLWDKEAVNLPYREIASLCRVGLGNVNNIMTGLKEEGFLVTLGRKRHKLVRQKELLDKWLAGYAEQLQPTLEVGTFKFAWEGDARWRDIPLNTDCTLWGGEPAGALLTGYLKPSLLTLYTLESRTELINNYRLLPASDLTGNVKVYKTFWHHEPNGNTVPPLLAYTDLINSNEPRCIETARKIYDEYLKDKF